MRQQVGPPDVVPPKTMFANNVGKNGQLFPKGHPYEEQASKPVRKEVEAMASDAVEVLSAATSAGIVWTVRRMARELTDKALRRAMQRQYNAEVANPERWKKRAAGHLADFKERIRPGLGLATANAIKGYTGNGHNGINMHLRGVRANSTVEPDIELIRAALLKYPMDNAVVTYRAVRGSKASEIFKIIKTLGVGEIIRFNGFTSTSIDPGVITIIPEDGTFMFGLRIHVPAGAPALYIEELSMHPPEFELLLGHNIKYRILGWEKVNGITIVDLKIVP